MESKRKGAENAEVIGERRWIYGMGRMIVIFYGRFRDLLTNIGPQNYFQCPEFQQF